MSCSCAEITFVLWCEIFGSSSVFFSYFLFRYGAIRGGYQHFSAQGGQDSFPSPRSALSYPFPPMHQNSAYSSYHLGGYAPPCASPPKDGE